MKYRKQFVSLVILIILLSSAQFVFAYSGSSTLRENQGLSLQDGHEMYVSQINIGEGSAWFEVRKDGEQKAFFKLYNQGTYTYRQNDIEIYMQLEQVFQGQVDSLAVVYIMMADVISDEETMLEVPLEEFPVEEVWEVPV